MRKQINRPHRPPISPVHAKQHRRRAFPTAASLARRRRRSLSLLRKRRGGCACLHFPLCDGDAFSAPATVAALLPTARLAKPALHTPHIPWTAVNWTSHPSRVQPSAHAQRSLPISRGVSWCSPQFTILFPSSRHLLEPR